MNNIYLIGRNLSKLYLKNLSIKIHANISSICAFTGVKINQGVLKSDLIGAKFTDYEYLKYNSDYCSIESALCLQYVIPKQDGSSDLPTTTLRNYSYLCTENELKIIKRENLLDTMFNLPNEPFIYVVSFSGQKHTSFKSKINYSNKDFIITTDKGNVSIKIDQKLFELIEIMSNWYSVIPNKKNTWFTKEEILNSSNNYKRIEEYGIEKYFKENSFISKYRNSLYLELLTHILNKKETIC